MVQGHQRTPGCTDLVKRSRRALLVSEACHSISVHTVYAFLRIIGQPDDLPATSVQALRACGWSDRGFLPYGYAWQPCKLGRDSHQDSTRLEQALHHRFIVISEAVGALSVEDWACRAENLGLQAWAAQPGHEEHRAYPGLPPPSENRRLRATLAGSEPG